MSKVGTKVDACEEEIRSIRSSLKKHDSGKCCTAIVIGPTDVSPLLATRAMHLLYERALKENRTDYVNRSNVVATVFFHNPRKKSPSAVFYAIRYSPLHVLRRTLMCITSVTMQTYRCSGPSFS
ncbi:hypothetical protein FIBSPDRAFT_874903 [Athelia psychrophila]|uniref:Uncharacterized protein n=1 Tax=Athelia psychrophila TaxID=1759441 RepID=A0A165WYB7_9AGAM|nr:hypothetical protein FIBSPDRAFT_874903 [Fibularhizoctonia sp. CBS 109695]